MSTLGKAVILFAADTAVFRGDVGRAVAIFESGVGRMQKVALGFKSTLAGGLTLGGVAVFTKGLIDQADELAKLSDRTGRQVESLSELKLAYELGGGSQEQFALGLREWNKSLVEATNNASRQAQVLKALGVDIKAGPTESFRQFAAAFAKLPDDLRISTAFELLKKGADGWIPVLAKGTQGLDDAAEKARKLGLVISTDFAHQAEQFNQNMKLLEKGSISLGNAILSNAAPAFAEISARMVEAAERGTKLKEAWSILQQINAQSLPASDPLSGKAVSPNETLIAAMMQGRLATGKIKGAAAASNFAGDLPLAGQFIPDPDAVKKALASQDLTKAQIHALEQMEEKKRSLNNLNEQELTLLRVTTGSYKDFDSDTKVRLLNMAEEIDYRNQLIERIRIGTEALLVEFNAQERGGEIFRDYVQTGKANLDQLNFEASLIGKTAREQEQMNALRQIDLQLLEKKRQAALAYGEEQAGVEQERSRLEKEAEKQRADVLGSIRKRQELERSWLMGAKVAFQEYGEAATNAAANTQTVFTNALSSVENAGVEFVRRRKLDLAALGDAIADDLARAGIRQFVTGPIATGIGKLFGNALEGGGLKLLDVEATRLTTSFVSMDASLLSLESSTLVYEAALINATAALETFTASAGGGAAASGGGGILGLLGLGGGAAAGGGELLDAGITVAAMAANGAVMTSRGPMALQRYSSGGIATGPQLAIFGEGRMNEAYVPLPDGKRIPVALQGALGGGKGGPTVFIDATNADREGLANLARVVERLDGTLESRAVGAVGSAMSRGGSFMHRMR